ncbi:TPA: hypothetical protein ACHVVB_005105 [Klebsiella pneumoniae]
MAQDMVSVPAAARPFPCLPFPVDFAFHGIYVFSAMTEPAKRYFPVVAGESSAVDPDEFRGPGAPFMMDAGQLSTGHTVCLGKAADGKRFYFGGKHSGGQ